MNEKNLAEEMMELRKLLTPVMMEKYSSKNEAVACPKPRKRLVRSVDTSFYMVSVMDLMKAYFIWKMI